jgi:GntR family transcriptional regulator
VARGDWLSNKYAPREAQYQLIERWLRQRVQQLAPGDPVPSEFQLAEQFAVSRMTARQAVQNLAAEGLVRRRRGQGTFVAPRPVHRREGSLMSFTEDMRRRGMTASSVLLEASLQPARVSDLEALQLDEGARSVVIRRLRLANGTPMALEHAVLPTDCAAVLAMDLEGSLHEALIKLGRVPSIGHSWISATVASKAEAALLGVPARSPLIAERRIIYSTVGSPIEHTETRYVAERYVIDAVFTAYSRPTAPDGEPVQVSDELAPIAP